MAVSNGLADALGTLDDAVSEVKKLAGVSGDQKIEIQVLPKPRSIFEQLLGGGSVEAEARSIAPELLEAAQTAATLKKLFAEPAVTVMPYVVRIR
jgi:ClpP class serine protease